MATDDFYRALEGRFRGSREATKERQRIYLPVVQMLAATQSKKMLDVGFGGAEWLELLKEQGIAAEGLQLNDAFLEEAWQAGFAVKKDDLFDYLAQQPDRSYSMISAFHVVEHLGIENLLAFLQEAYRVTDADGAILLETSNPANLMVRVCNFYIDPTHERSLSSTLLGFAAEFCGFERVVMVPANRDFLHIELQLLPGSSPSAAVVNTAPSVLDKNRKQAPDYAIFAFKKMDNKAVEVAEALVTQSVLPVSTAESIDVNSLWARVVDVETDRAVWRGKAEAAEAEARHAKDLVDRAESRIADFEARVRDLQSRSILEKSTMRAKEQERLRDLEAQFKQAQSRAAEAEDIVARVQQRIDAIFRSTSWPVSSRVRVVGYAVGGVKGLVGRTARATVLRAAAYVRNRPKLKQRLATTLSRFPRVRARFIRLAGLDAIQGVVTGASIPVVETVDRLTARGKKIHADLLSARSGRTSV
ncbi:methyltransferase domain-containing protein [Caballeronia mineralivorans]|uniref:methyltransferase domain-containing protein n=1 Tax=Caballeronia mineralivorans TaxID=2010198 RepID=UPI00069FA7FA|nr:methyltransferase domain-containing protein [Caballeronia mineralivorans]